MYVYDTRFPMCRQMAHMGGYILFDWPTGFLQIPRIVNHMVGLYQDDVVSGMLMSTPSHVSPIIYPLFIYLHIYVHNIIHSFSFSPRQLIYSLSYLILKIYT